MLIADALPPSVSNISVIRIGQNCQNMSLAKKWKPLISQIELICDDIAWQERTKFRQMVIFIFLKQFTGLAKLFQILSSRCCHYLLQPPPWISDSPEVPHFNVDSPEVPHFKVFPLASDSHWFDEGGLTPGHCRLDSVHEYQMASWSK